MKKITCVLIVFLLSLSMYAQQSIYYDAILLNSKIDPGVGNKIMLTQEVKQVIKKTFPTVDINKINQNFLDQQPFLKGMFVDQAAGALDISKFIDKGISSVGDFDVTNRVDGLVKFLLERSKEELNVAFFRKFQEFLKGYPEARILLPETNSFLEKFNSYQYTAMLPALRAAFFKDLNELTSNLINIRSIIPGDCNGNTDCETRIQKINSYLNSQPGHMVLATIIVADNLKKGINAADIISNLANDPVCTANTSENFSNVINLTNLILNSLRSTDASRIWITNDQINELIKNETELKIYLGLLYAKNTSNPVVFKIKDKNYAFSDLLQKVSEWGDVKNKFILSFKQLSGAASQVADEAKKIKDLKSKADDDEDIMVYAEYASSFAHVFEYSVSLLDNFTSIDPDFKIKKELAKFSGIIGDATAMYYDIKAKSYSAFILHSSIILDSLFTDNADYEKFRGDYIKYGIFIANIVEAKNSDDVQSAIEGAVLPIGSSSIKRETNCNISINAYIGPTVGGEYMPQRLEQQLKPVFGLTAPVGVAFSWGNIHNGKRKNDPQRSDKGGQSFTIFVPLIDLGAIATFRLGDDSTKIASTIQLKDIVAPGLYFYYGFGKCPVSLGIGCQVGPQLREVTAENKDETQNIYFRFGLNLVVDIPFFNVYTKN